MAQLYWGRKDSEDSKSFRLIESVSRYCIYVPLFCVSCITQHEIGLGASNKSRRDAAPVDPTQQGNVKVASPPTMPAGYLSWRLHNAARKPALEYLISQCKMLQP